MVVQVLQQQVLIYEQSEFKSYCSRSERYSASALKVWVEGYGHAIAGDTGGAIKGKKIDFHVPTKE